MNKAGISSKKGFREASKQYTLPMFTYLSQSPPWGSIQVFACCADTGGSLGFSFSPKCVYASMCLDFLRVTFQILVI